jgi:hypothetical protein
VLALLLRVIWPQRKPVCDTLCVCDALWLNSLQFQPQSASFLQVASVLDHATLGVSHPNLRADVYESCPAFLLVNWPAE